MSEEIEITWSDGAGINWGYLPAAVNLAEKIKIIHAWHNSEPRPSVVSHWGIASRELRLKAIHDDQVANLHSLVEQGVCSCGLVISAVLESPVLALVLSKHHRNHLTLEHEPDPTFRGIVGKRHFGLGSQALTDKTWDEFVSTFLVQSRPKQRFVPLTWKLADVELDYRDQNQK
jgi:hypothetical protein